MHNKFDVLDNQGGIQNSQDIMDEATTLKQADDANKNNQSDDEAKRRNRDQDKETWLKDSANTK